MKENTIALALVSALLVTPAAAQNDDAKAELVRLKPNDFPTAPIEYTVVYPAGGGMFHLSAITVVVLDALLFGLAGRDRVGALGAAEELQEIRARIDERMGVAR